MRRQTSVYAGTLLADYTGMETNNYKTVSMTDIGNYNNHDKECYQEDHQNCRLIKLHSSDRLATSGLVENVEKTDSDKYSSYMIKMTLEIIAVPNSLDE